jgi:S-adenosylmethionine hydrolase
LITLTTDFGLEDAYTASMKGMILSINPQATVIDLCPAVQPQNIAQAAFVLSTGYHYFPPGTIHVVVVDPGVGTRRRAVVLATPSAVFVAPDNGVLSYVVEEAIWEAGGEARLEEGQTALQGRLLAIALTNPHFWHHPVSNTFHGRDIFAPVAAHLSLGVPIHDLGEPVSSLFTFPYPHAKLREDKSLIGRVLHIDHFGNLITSFRMEDLPEGRRLFIRVAGHIVEGIAESYAEADDLLALIGSSGNLEVAVKNGSAARLIGAKIGSEVTITSL